MWRGINLTSICGMLRVAEGLQASNTHSHETKVVAQELKLTPTGRAAQLALYDALLGKVLSSCLVLWPLDYSSIEMRLMTPWLLLRSLLSHVLVVYWATKGIVLLLAVAILPTVRVKAEEVPGSRSDSSLSNKGTFITLKPQTMYLGKLPKHAWVRAHVIHLESINTFCQLSQVPPMPTGLPLAESREIAWW